MNFENISIGSDMEDIIRFERYSNDKNCNFLKRVFTEAEVDYCYSYKTPAKHLAVRFCAKEACVKALSFFGIKDVYYNQIEIYRDSNSSVGIRILQERYPEYIFRLSLSHCSDKAVANVIAIKKA